MAVDWRGDFHLRQLSAFLLIFWRLPRHRPRKKALIRGTFWLLLVLK